ncbi:hypothetical protein C7974DRAFT_380497 [Boeremia exigua]|uniref:uncharacterized protein n=1 Tax=Boeremia exigua TaxID=749465 RepID=UPI001E8D890F|nr:uncharacterized protein C7974DRAFT_380497 [Boeremia exigua]KAH6614126.1 hypothetical protein C7974DRAFT_380497 [Boeremia exigua]
MTAGHSPALAAHLLRLPRELRDLIYAFVFRDLPSVPLDAVRTGLAGLALPALHDTAALTPELLEAFYTHATFRVQFSDRHPSPLGRSAFPAYETHIRRLEIDAVEASLPDPLPLDALEAACRGSPSRVRWEALLQLPRLEHLAIRLQKTARGFCWADFSPVVVRLRERQPRPRISFSVSFDWQLEAYWNSPMWTVGGEENEVPYEPMGFVDVTALIGPPTEEDRAYVREHNLSEQPTLSRDPCRGLIGETAAQRRVLAETYVVKEPALLRVLIMEHYEVYKRMRGEK